MPCCLGFTLLPLLVGFGLLSLVSYVCLFWFLIVLCVRFAGVYLFGVLVLRLLLDCLLVCLLIYK